MPSGHLPHTVHSQRGPCYHSDHHLGCLGMCAYLPREWPGHASVSPVPPCLNHCILRDGQGLLGGQSGDTEG